MTSFEVWLLLGALGLYLFDSMVWLYSNELIFLRKRGQWSSAQVPGLLIAGRRLYWPNPLTPGVAQFKVRWSDSDQRSETEEAGELDRFLRALRPVQYLVNALLVILLVLPLELLLFGTGVELLIVMAAFYLLIVVTLVVVYLRRGELHLTGRGFAALCFDALACAPFAVNLVRKLALRRSLVGNPIQFAARSFETEEFGRLIDSVTARVVEEQQREAEHSARWEQLEAYRERLKGIARPGQG
jgi:hypothetical protein